MRKSIIAVTAIWFLLFLGVNADAGDFVSGSTGADGAFNPTANTELQLPANGIFNFTTVNIPTGVTITFKKNAANTPVYILATGDVNIAGTIDVNGENGMDGNTGSTGPIYGGKGGPGGFDGGSGGEPASTGVNEVPSGSGLGPGGSIGGDGTTIWSGYSYYWDPPLSRYCYLNNGQAGSYASKGATYCNTPSSLGAFLNGAGSIYGTPALMPLIGGSGGGGGRPGSSLGEYGGGGAGGGGAILIASSTKINITGSIKAEGGKGGNYTFQQVYGISYSRNYGGGGSGGGVKLIANRITISGSVSANGGSTSSGTNINTRGGDGRIRLETNNLSQTGSISPSPSVTTPNSVFIPNTPTLSITKIAGNSVPASASGSYATPDITLSSTTTNPVSIEISATNIPAGTSVKITATPLHGSQTSADVTLAGTNASSTATASMSISLTEPSVFTATTTFTIQTAMFYDGEKIEKVRVAANVGKESDVTYITESGKEIPAALLTAKVMR